MEPKVPNPRLLFCLQLEFATILNMSAETGVGVHFTCYEASPAMTWVGQLVVAWPSLPRVVDAQALIHFIAHILLPKKRNRVLDGWE